ncbi:MAG: L,D-transpeptidase family protein [Candidatus Eisenbacteria bacterium]|uniref:L,D-transpeptidase family protein n=1 Tax=Eiseniibacteriota bacterium TaxID=2212470 RepID=A0A849SSJ5_UNCEI|nr:L,D-transpeptidase family protein [Candidatus Eisenbacteria bacterium]
MNSTELSKLARMVRWGGAVAVLLMLGATSCGPAVEKPPPEPRLDEGEVRASLEALLERDRARDTDSTSITSQAVRFYAARDGRPAWLSRGQPTSIAGELVGALQTAATHGLDPTDYETGALDSLLQSVRAAGHHATGAGRPAMRAALDRKLTRAYLAFANDRLRGRFDPATFAPNWHSPRWRDLDLVPQLERAIAHKQVAAALDSLDPVTPEYAQLREALASLRWLEAAGGWPRISAGELLKPGASDPRVPELRARLAPEGSSALGDSADMRYDKRLAAAVRAFQRRVGLQADGEIGVAARRELNLPIEDRIARIEINLERLRWARDAVAARHVQVNLPEYAVHLWDGDTLARTIRAVVGFDTTRTPIFEDTLSHIIFGPSWRLPMSIIRNEVIPAMIRDKSYIEKHFMKVYLRADPRSGELRPDSINWKKLQADSIPIFVRQEPGIANPLGRVKFMCPNPWDIYLHDTPTRGTFTRADRRASHGCVRLERPSDFALWLLRNSREPWDSLLVAAAMDTSHDKVVMLPKRVPVFFAYRTAWIDPAGELQFRRDVYGYDSLHARRVGRPLERLVIAKRE